METFMSGGIRGLTGESQEKENDTGLVNQVPPIGSVIAWHKALVDNSNSHLPRGWMECNGQQIDKGPLKGKVLPNLNAEKRFLRGSNTSGVSEEDQLQTHRHEHSIEDDGAHQHSLERTVWSQAMNETYPPQTPPNERQNYSGMSDQHWPKHYLVKRTKVDGKHSHKIEILDPSPTNMVRTGDETRPKNMSVVWIMRVE
jgi:hypothetical protein